eukprot:287540-Rhodomonas_salina.1
MCEGGVCHAVREPELVSAAQILQDAFRSFKVSRSWALHKLAQLCVGESEISSRHCDEEREMACNAPIPAVQRRVDKLRLVLLGEPSPRLELGLDSRLVPRAVDLQDLSSVDRLAE